MTVKKKVLFVVPVVLLLALCVAPVNAGLIVSNEVPSPLAAGTHTVNINVNYNDYVDLSIFGDGDYTCSQSDYNYLINKITESKTVEAYKLLMVQPSVLFGKNIINVNCIGAPEPTPVPVNPYISVTELYSDNLGTVYRFQCLPSGDTIRYSNIVPYIIPAYMAPAYAGELTSSQTSIEYRVPAGGTSEFSAVYATAPLTVGVISTTVTAPALTPAENQTYNPIPDPAQKPLTPFTSGKFQPTLTSGQVDVISKSPYVALLSNLNQSMQLPIMESPDSIRNKLVPDDLENITGPLYDTAAGWAEFTNFVPRLVADTMIGVYSPFLSAIADCKSVLLSFTGQLAELMKPVYILSPVFYLFIPDLVWIGVCLVLVLLIIHALLVFVLGEDTVVYFMGRDTIVADAIPDFPALEK